MAMAHDFRVARRLRVVFQPEYTLQLFTETHIYYGNGRIKF